MQLKFDLSKPIKNLEEEKKTELVSLRIGDKFKADLDALARAKNCSLSELCFEYLINSYTEDYKQYLLLQQNGDRTLRDLLSNFK